MSSDILAVNQQGSKNVYSQKMMSERSIDISDYERGQFSYKAKQDAWCKKKTILSLSTIALGATNLFEIPNSSKKISNVYLEIYGSGTSVYSTGKIPIFNIIKSIEIEHGSIKLNKISGKSLYNLFSYYNNMENNLETIIYNLGGGAGGDIDNTHMFIPLPILNNIIGSLDLSNKNYLNGQYPMGLSNQNLRINIELNSGSYISKTNDYELSGMKIHYYEWFDQEFSSISNIQTQTTNLFSRNSIYFREQDYSFTLVNATDYTSLDISNVLIDGECDMVILSLTPTTNTEKTWLESNIQLDKITVDLNGTKIYETDSKNDMVMQNIFYNKNKLQTSSAGYFHVIPFNSIPYLNMKHNIMMTGVNMSQSKPTITLHTISGGAAYTCTVLAVYKCTYVINGGRDPNVILK